MLSLVLSTRKCLVLRLGGPKQTSGGTGPSDLACKVRLISDQLALGIRAHRKPYLPQALPALLQSLLLDDLLLPDGLASNESLVADNEAAEAAEVLPVGSKPAAEPLLWLLRLRRLNVVGHLEESHQRELYKPLRGNVKQVKRSAQRRSFRK